MDRQNLAESRQAKGEVAGKGKEFLMHEISRSGPVRGDWPNYGKLSPGRHHCHIKKGKPTYVAVWEEMDGEIMVVEITYVGTHEKAPY